MSRGTSEAVLEERLRRRVIAAGGKIRKVSWPGVRGAPDRFVMLPGYHCFIELKGASGRLAGHQMREIASMRSSGVSVFVVHGENELEDLFQVLGV